MILRDLAIRHQALETADISVFQRKFRILQSIWREERGFEPLVDGDRVRGAELSLTWAKESLANFLTEPVREVVREVVFKRDKEDRQLFAEPRIYNHLLSSQPLCFNLFGELSLDLPLADRVFNDLTSGNIREVREIRFEYSPDRGNQNYLGDHSAFDVFWHIPLPPVRMGSSASRSNIMKTFRIRHPNIKNATQRWPLVWAASSLKE